MDAWSDEATDRRSVGRRNCISALIIASARTALIPGVGPREVRPTRQSPEKVFSRLEVVVGSVRFGSATRDSDFQQRNERVLS